MTTSEIAARVWEQGTPVDGPLHVSAVPAAYSPLMFPMAYTWPLGKPVSAFFLDPGSNGAGLYKIGVSRMVDDPESVRALRALREQYLIDRRAQPGAYDWDGLKTTDAVDTAFVYMRDAIPYEDARGLLQFE